MTDSSSAVPTAQQGVAPSPPAYSVSHGIACACISTVLGTTWGMAGNLASNNLTFIQGALGATLTEATWISTAYYATFLSASVLLTKIRLQVDLRKFAALCMLFFLARLLRPRSARIKSLCDEATRRSDRIMADLSDNMTPGAGMIKMHH